MAVGRPGYHGGRRQVGMARGDLSRLGPHPQSGVSRPDPRVPRPHDHQLTRVQAQHLGRRGDLVVVLVQYVPDLGVPLSEPFDQRS